jgi:UrcA family protein
MTTTTHVNRKLTPLLACGLAAVFIAAASPRASADTPVKASIDGRSYSVKVDYNLADLATESGLDKIYTRLKGAARRVCDAASEPSDPKKVRHYWECVDEAVANAVNDINNQRLTAFHEREADKHKRAS